MADTTVIGDDGLARCAWGASPPDHIPYHDHEWGRGELDDTRLFEKVCLEGFQAGLSWLTVLRKRDRFREVFAGFDPYVVADYGDDEVAAMLGDPGIIRHEGKIRSTINNAQRAVEMIDECGSLAKFFWRFADLSDRAPTEVPALTDASTDLGKQLKRRGWTFVGPTTMYAFMQAMGLVNDHVDGCYSRPLAQNARLECAATIGLNSAGDSAGLD